VLSKSDDCVDPERGLEQFPQDDRVAFVVAKPKAQGRMRPCKVELSSHSNDLSNGAFPVSAESAIRLWR
jgi:hypothetical protein